jgi:hypothetical protein
MGPLLRAWAVVEAVTITAIEARRNFRTKQPNTPPHSKISITDSHRPRA